MDPANEPAPGVPAEPTTQPAPGAPADSQAAPTATSAGGANDPVDVASLPPNVQKLIGQLRADATKARSTAKQTAADEARTAVTAQIAKALGIGQEGQPVSAEDLAGQIEQHQAAAWRSGVELQLYKLAGTLGANAEALLDSVSFVDSLDDLVDADPRDPDFTEQLKAKVQAAMERNPVFRAGQTATAAPAGPRPDLSQGARGAGPDLDSRIAEAQKRGDFMTVISLQNQKLKI